MPEPVNLIIPGDIIIGPNGSIWTSVRVDSEGNQIPTSNRNWNTSISNGGSEAQINMAVIPREGATVETLQESLSTYPDRVLGVTDGYFTLVAEDLAGAETPGRIIEIHEMVVRTALVRDVGMSEKEAEKIVENYSERLRSSGVTDLDELRNSRIGMDYVRDTMQERVNPILNNTDLLESFVTSDRPMHRGVFTVDLNGRLIESEDIVGAQARVSTQPNLATPIPSDISETVDDLVYFAQREAAELNSQTLNGLGATSSVDEALGVHQSYINEMAEHLNLEGEVRASFTSGYMSQLNGLELSEIQNTGLVEERVNVQIQSLGDAVTSEDLNLQAVDYRNAHYQDFDRHVVMLREQLEIISNQYGYEDIMPQVRVELAQGSYSFGGGSTGAEARVGDGAIAVSHTMLEGVEQGRMSPEILRRHLSEEFRHTIDLNAGISDRYTSFVEEIYADETRRQAWADFAADKNKSPPSYYREYGGLETEFMVDLVDMEDELARGLGSRELARERVVEIFGEPAGEMLNEFRAEESRLSGVRTAATEMRETPRNVDGDTVSTRLQGQYGNLAPRFMEQPQSQPRNISAVADDIVPPPDPAPRPTGTPNIQASQTTGFTHAGEVRPLEDIVIAGGTERHVSTPEEALDILRDGQRNLASNIDVYTDDFAAAGTFNSAMADGNGGASVINASLGDSPTHVVMFDRNTGSIELISQDFTNGAWMVPSGEYSAAQTLELSTNRWDVQLQPGQELYVVSMSDGVPTGPADAGRPTINNALLDDMGRYLSETPTGDVDFARYLRNAAEAAGTLDNASVAVLPFTSETPAGSSMSLVVDPSNISAENRVRLEGEFADIVEARTGTVDRAPLGALSAATEMESARVVEAAPEVRPATPDTRISDRFNLSAVNDRAPSVPEVSPRAPDVPDTPDTPARATAVAAETATDGLSAAQDMSRLGSLVEEVSLARKVAGLARGATNVPVAGTALGSGAIALTRVAHQQQWELATQMRDEGIISDAALSSYGSMLLTAEGVQGIDTTIGLLDASGATILLTGVVEGAVGNGYKNWADEHAPNLTEDQYQALSLSMFPSSSARSELIWESRAQLPDSIAGQPEVLSRAIELNNLYEDVCRLSRTRDGALYGGDLRALTNRALELGVELGEPGSGYPEEILRDSIRQELISEMDDILSNPDNVNTMLDTIGIDEKLEYVRRLAASDPDPDELRWRHPEIAAYVEAYDDSVFGNTFIDEDAVLRENPELLDEYIKQRTLPGYEASRAQMIAENGGYFNTLRMESIVEEFNILASGGHQGALDWVHDNDLNDDGIMQIEELEKTWIEMGLNTDELQRLARGDIDIMDAVTHMNDELGIISKRVPLDTLSLDELRHAVTSDEIIPEEIYVEGQLISTVDAYAEDPVKLQSDLSIYENMQFNGQGEFSEQIALLRELQERQAGVQEDTNVPEAYPVMRNGLGL